VNWPDWSRTEWLVVAVGALLFFLWRYLEQRLNKIEQLLSDRLPPPIETDDSDEE
jgi:hypothetical protein